MLAHLSNFLRSFVRFAFGSSYGRVLAIPLLFAAAYFLVALFTYYRGTYDPPESPDIRFEEITTALSAHTIFTEQPEIRSGLVVIDGAHNNDFSQNEIVFCCPAWPTGGLPWTSWENPAISAVLGESIRKTGSNFWKANCVRRAAWQ